MQFFSVFTMNFNNEVKYQSLIEFPVVFLNKVHNVHISRRL